MMQSMHRYFAVWGPSDIPYSESFPPVKPLSKAQLTELEEAYVAAIKRCEAIGCRPSIHA